MMQETMLNQAYRCLECGKCTGVCPVARFSDSFSPRRLLSNIVSNVTSTDGYWSCLTCMQCDTICPADIQYAALIQAIREANIMEQPKDLCSHGGIFESIMHIMSSNKLMQQRLDWLDNQQQISADSEYLFFVGCMPYFDQIFPSTINIARSTLKILNYFDIRPQILPNEKCCGHDALWMGDRKNFISLAKDNLKQIQTSGAKTIITSCPECCQAIRQEYTKQFGKQPFEVYHISEFLYQIMKEKNHRIKSEPHHVTYQDPCRLGRHLGVYEQPRRILAEYLNLPFSEMLHHHARATCCGVTNWMNCSQMTKAMQVKRLQEARQTGAELLITACPKCKIHLECAQKNAQLAQGIDIKIQDITELIANTL
jgi:heterodisulfide reductase subunit D